MEWRQYPNWFDYRRETQQLCAAEPEAEIVRFVFRRLIETHSPSTVANEANSLGYRTKLRTVVRRNGSSVEVGGKRFDEDTVKAIVHNPIYKGFIRYDGELYPGTHEPLVDQETWEEANKAIGNGRPDNGIRYKDDHVSSDKKGNGSPGWYPKACSGTCLRLSCGACRDGLASKSRGPGPSGPKNGHEGWHLGK